MNPGTIIYLLLLFILPCKGEDWHAIYKDSNKSWMERWGYLAAHADEMPSNTRIEILSHLLGNENNPNYRDEQLEVARKITRILINTPGHAEYFGNLLKATPRNHNRRYWYQYLQNLPSPETVRVLGELLADDSERPALAEDRSNLEEYFTVNPNCDRAVKVLQHLLDNPPVPKGSDYEFNRDLEAWRLWWERVKAGKQTFRFVGDPQEYTLEGPAPKETLERIARDRKRDAERAAGYKKAVESSDVPESPAAAVSSKSIPTAILIAAMGLLVSLAWYFMGRRKSGS